MIIWNFDASSFSGWWCDRHRSLIQVVGLTSGYHTGLVIASKGNLVHAKRICQVPSIRIELQAQHVRPDGRYSQAYLQVDACLATSGHVKLMGPWHNTVYPLISFQG